MKRVKDFFWPLIGLAAVIWSLDLLYKKLRLEAVQDAKAAADPDLLARIDHAGFLESLSIIASQIGLKLAAIPMQGYLLAGLSTLFAYWALAWYDRIALIHLNRQKGISWLFITTCSFVTYAISHNIGGSVFSGGMVRYSAYTSKGLSAPEVAVLVALCSFTFAFGTIVLGGLVLTFEPHIVRPLAPLSESIIRIIGLAMLAFCVLYTIGSWLKFQP
ncbi:MAG: YbhN family protein, partial [Methylobacterium sp.]